MVSRRRRAKPRPPPERTREGAERSQAAAPTEATIDPADLSRAAGRCGRRGCSRAFARPGHARPAPTEPNPAPERTNSRRRRTNPTRVGRRTNPTRVGRRTNPRYLDLRTGRGLPKIPVVRVMTVDLEGPSGRRVPQRPLG